MIGLGFISLEQLLHIFSKQNLHNFTIFGPASITIQSALIKQQTEKLFEEEKKEKTHLQTTHTPSVQVLSPTWFQLCTLGSTVSKPRGVCNQLAVTRVPDRTLSTLVPHPFVFEFTWSYGYRGSAGKWVIWQLITDTTYPSKK